MSELIDTTMLEQLLGLEPSPEARAALFLQLLDTYRSDNLAKVERLADCIAEQAYDEAREIAHSMRGAALSMGAVQVAALAKECEFSCGENRGRLEAQAATLEAALKASIAALEAKFT